MAIDRVNEILSLINNQSENQEKMQLVLMKAHALSEVSMAEDFFEYDKSITHAYLWVLSDLINQATLMHEEFLFYFSKYIKIGESNL